MPQMMIDPTANARNRVRVLMTLAATKMTAQILANSASYAMTVSGYDVVNMPRYAHATSASDIEATAGSRSDFFSRANVRSAALIDAVPIWSRYEMIANVYAQS